jgi:hypothetical protein
VSASWKEVGAAITKVAPALGSVFGPAGAAVGGLVSVVGRAFGLGDNPTPDAVLTALQTSPDAAVKLAQIEADHKDRIIAALVAMRQADSEDLNQVNQTIRADEQGQSWLQRNHHAIECLATVAWVIAVYFWLPVFKITPPTIPTEAFLMVGAILGVAAYGKGQANVAAIKAAE